MVASVIQKAKRQNKEQIQEAQTQKQLMWPPKHILHSIKHTDLKAVLQYGKKEELLTFFSTIYKERLNLFPTQQ